MFRLRTVANRCAPPHPRHASRPRSCYHTLRRNAEPKTATTPDEPQEAHHGSTERDGGRRRPRPARPRPHRGARSARAQPEEHRRQHPAEPARRHRGRVGVGQVVARPGRAVRRGVAALPGSALHLHAPPPDAGGPRLRGRGAARARRARPAPAAQRARRAQHLRHVHRAAEQPAPAVLARRQPRVPERPPRAAHAERRRRAPYRVPRLRRGVLRPRRGRLGIQQRRRLSRVRRNGHRAHRGPGLAGARRDAHHRRRRRRSLEHAHVGPHEAGRARDGRAHRRALQPADARRARHRVFRPSREEAHPVQGEEDRHLRRAGLHLLQRRLHRGERVGEGEGREGSGARGALPQAGRLPRVRRHAPLPGGAPPAGCGHRPGRGVREDPRRAGRLDGRRARRPHARDAPDGAQHRRVVPAHGAPPRRFGAGLSRARSRGLHAVHRRAPARAAGPRRAQPNHRRAVRAGRAVHRPAPLQHRRARRGDARFARRRQLGGHGGPRHAHPGRRRLARGDGTGRGR